MADTRPGEKQAKVWISEGELDRWKRYIRQKYAIPEAYGRYQSVEADAAIVEFLDRDAAREAEAIVRAIDEALTHSSEEYAEGRTTDSREIIRKIDADRGPTELFRPLISAKRHAQLKKFVAEVNEASDMRELKLSEAFEVAMRERRLGGRKKRIADRGTAMLDALDADVDAPTDAPEIAVEIEDTAAEDEDTTDFEHPPHTVEGKLERIRASLADRSTYTVDELYQDGGELPIQYVIDAIDEHCTRGGRDTATDRTREKYLDLIEQDLGLVEQPNGVIYDLVDPAVLDQPAFEYKEADQLSRQERAERVAVEALNRLDQQYGQSVGTDEIPRLFRGVEIEDAEAGKIRDRAGDLDGLSVRELKSGKRVVATDPNAVDDALLRSAGMAESEPEPESESEPEPATEPEPSAESESAPDDGDDTAAAEPAEVAADAAATDQGETSDADEDAEQDQDQDRDRDRAEIEQEAADRLAELSEATIAPAGAGGAR